MNIDQANKLILKHEALFEANNCRISMKTDDTGTALLIESNEDYRSDGYWVFLSDDLGMARVVVKYLEKKWRIK